MFAENLGRAYVVKGACPTHPTTDICQDGPIVTCGTGGAEHGALAADGAVRIGHRAAFFGPSGCGQQNIGTARGIGLRGDVADDYEIASGNRGRYRIRIRHRHGGVRVDDPDSFDLLICHGAEHIHRLEVRALGQRACVSELLHRCTVVCIFQIEVAREHVRKPTHFAAAHRIRLARY